MAGLKRGGDDVEFRSRFQLDDFLGIERERVKHPCGRHVEKRSAGGSTWSILRPHPWQNLARTTSTARLHLATGHAAQLNGSVLIHLGKCAGATPAAERTCELTALLSRIHGMAILPSCTLIDGIFGFGLVSQHFDLGGDFLEVLIKEVLLTLAQPLVKFRFRRL